jgi:transposase
MRGFVSSKDVSFERVVIAVDPHKASWTAAVVSSSLQPLATLRVPVSAGGLSAAAAFCRPLAASQLGDRRGPWAGCPAGHSPVR